jgi:cytoplasmic iron level regulating protein YaaA (DUF328/UPF0246 family)
MIILLHSSKTMRRSPEEAIRLREPQLLEKAKRLDTYLKTLSPPQLTKIMSISPALAEKTYALIAAWTTRPEDQSLTIDSFVGDIYSGLHANDLSPADRDYADQTLRILSGLYGILRPYDGICPYRLEMGYTLPDPSFTRLPAYWGESIAACLPKTGPIINLAAGEYAQTVIPFVDASRLIVPRFFTVSPKTGEPTFVVVHAKIARGAFARWLIRTRISESTALTQFNDLGYHFVGDLSSANSPAFVCETFEGKGRSLRLQ